MRGGNSSDGSICGLFCVYLRLGAGTTGWYYGAALLLLHIILHVAELLMVIQTGVLF